MLDSVAPELNIISFLSELSSVDILYLASSTIASLLIPYKWPFECGFPYSTVKYGSILSKTLKSIGVVAYISKYNGLLNSLLHFCIVD